MDSIGLGSAKNSIIFITFLIVIALIISIAIWRKKNNLLLGTTLFSVLSYLTFYLSVDSRIFAIYNLKWIVKFTLYYWPWINLALLILLIVNFIKNKNAKKID
jgi:hypothetical protein